MNLKNNPERSPDFWIDTVFLAEAEQEPFADVRIETLYSHCLLRAQELNVPLGHIEGQEYVEVKTDHILVVIDVETIEDETIYEALNMLNQLDTFDVGSKKILSPKRKFNYIRSH